MNIVTYKTAKRLKDAGFPQPEPDVLQVWYEPYSFMPFVISANNGTDIDGKYLYRRGGKSHIERRLLVDFDESYIFAPNTIDIFEHIEEWHLFRSKSGYSILCYMEGNNYLITTKTPAEACAAAWLAIYEKSQPK